MICAKCGKEISDASAYCIHCGSKVENAVAENGTKGVSGKTVKVIFQRKKRFMGCAISMKIHIDGNVVAVLKNGEIKEVDVLPGKHKLILETVGEVSQREIDISDQYSKVYIDLVMKMGLVSGRAEIISIRNEI